MSLSRTAEHVLDAYGGEARWKDATCIAAVLSADGLAFRSRRWRPLVHCRVEVDLGFPRVRFLHGHGTVTWREDGSRSIEGANQGLPIAQLHFVGMALWNYLALPRLLLRADIAWSEPSFLTLRGGFPAHLPTHCAEQEFHFSKEGLLLRHDYTARFFGRWAKAANRVTEHGASDGCRFPRRRKVTPRLGPLALPAPTLVSLEVSEWQIR